MLAIAAFIFCLIGTAQSVAQNAYIANLSSATVTVVDTKTNAVAATIVTGPAPYGVAFSPDGGSAYITNAYSNSPDNVFVVDTKTNAVTATIPLGAPAIGAVVSPDGRRVYVTSNFGFVSVIDAASNTVIATIPLRRRALGSGGYPRRQQGLCFNPKRQSDLGYRYYN